MTTLHFLVQKNALHNTAMVEQPETPLQPGQVRVRIDRFALTSNNITYAAFGDAMNYWKFFPVSSITGATPEATDAMGRIPVWGFGDVVQSEQPEVAVGERLYGYFPMSSDVVLEPCRLSATGFSDGAAHRAELHALYNQYQRCNADPLYTEQTEDLLALLRPLFMTAWLLDDFLADNAFFGAAQAAPAEPGAILLSSASSKTASATAWGLRQRNGVEVIGLTSAANQAYCESLGCYHRVLSYDQLDALAAGRPCVYVDFAGNAALRMRIHTRFGNLKYSCSIGATHVDEIGGGRNLPGPPATLFFAPDQAKKRAAEWGAGEFAKRMLAAWRAFLAVAADKQRPWIQVQHHHGPEQVSAAYQQVLGGKGAAICGHMLTLR